jgi:hypothetical protein
MALVVAGVLRACLVAWRPSLLLAARMVPGWLGSQLAEQAEQVDLKPVLADLVPS